MSLRRMKTPISYYGGKQLMLKHILPLIPEHRIYTEVFFGGGAVYFAKEPAKVEVINDIDREVVNFFEQLKDHPRKFAGMAKRTLHSRLQYKEALVMYRYPHLFTKLERAWAFWMLTNQGYAKTIGSWSYSRTNPVVGAAKKQMDFQELAERLERTQIECNDAVKVLESRDAVDSFHYIDPPYMNADQGHYSGYAESAYIDLLEALASIKGKFY